MLAAESAILVKFDSVGVVLLVFLGVVITLLAFCAGECNLVSRSGHFGTSYFNIPFKASLGFRSPYDCGGAECVFAGNTHKKISPFFEVNIFYHI